MTRRAPASRVAALARRRSLRRVLARRARAAAPAASAQRVVSLVAVDDRGAVRRSARATASSGARATATTRPRSRAARGRRLRRPELRGHPRAPARPRRRRARARRSARLAETLRAHGIATYFPRPSRSREIDAHDPRPRRAHGPRGRGARSVVDALDAREARRRAGRRGRAAAARPARLRRSRPIVVAGPGELRRRDAPPRGRRRTSSPRAARTRRSASSASLALDPGRRPRRLRRRVAAASSASRADAPGWRERARRARGARRRRSATSASSARARASPKGSPSLARALHPDAPVTELADGRVPKVRLDQLLVARGLAPIARARAGARPRGRGVRRAGARVDKAGDARRRGRRRSRCAAPTTPTSRAAA